MHVTTPFTLKTDLRDTLRLRGVAVGGTVGDFLNALMALGIKLDDPLASIEWRVSQFGTGRVICEQNEDGEGWEIREKQR